MITTMVLALVVAAAPAPTLEAAFKREVALLAAERLVLQAERSRIVRARDDELEGLRAEIAAVSAELLTVRADVARARARGAPVDVVMPTAAPIAPPPIAATFAALRTARPTVSTGDVAGIAALPIAIAALRERQSLRFVETGFFDVDGAYVDGTAFSVGGFGGAVAKDGRVAGPALTTSEGALQLAVADDGFAAAARGIVAKTDTAMIPVWIKPATGDSDDNEAAIAVEATPLLVRAQRLGAPFVIVLLTLLGSLVGALAIYWRVRRQSTSLSAAGHLLEMVRAGEFAAAEALARTVEGASGRFVQAVISACRRTSGLDRDLDDEALAPLLSAVFLDLDRARQRVLMAGVAASAIAVAVAVFVVGSAFDALSVASTVENRAILSTLGDGLLLLQMSAVWAVPFVVVAVAVVSGVAAVKQALETLALAVVDASMKRRSA